MNIEYSIPKFGSVSKIFFFAFTTCVIRCVSSFDLGRLSLGLGPTLPTHQSTLPCPWMDSLAKVIHAYCSLPAPEYERHYYTTSHVLHISRRPIFWHNMLEWVMVHCRARISRPANVLFQTMLQEMQMQVCSFKACYSFAPHHCMLASWALQEPPQAIA